MAPIKNESTLRAVPAVANKDYIECIIGNI